MGTDPTGHLENMPPAVLAERVARRLGGGPLDASTNLRIQNVIHYTFGAVSAAVYGALAESVPVRDRRRGNGRRSGPLSGQSWDGAAVRIQEPPWRLPRVAFAWQFTSHLLFGLALELGRRSASRILAVRS